MKNRYLKHACCLYRCYDIDRSLLYVGISVDFEARMRQHAGDKWWWPNIDHVEVEWFCTRTEAEAQEAQAIWQERPKHNVQNPISQRYRARPHDERVGEVIPLADALLARANRKESA